MQHTTKKHKHIIRNIILFIGSFTVTFLLVLTLVIPIINRDFLLEKIDESKQKQTQHVGDSNNWWIYIEKEPYVIYQEPVMNYSKFWKVFKKHVFWSLEAKHPVTGEWINQTQLLNINRNYTSNNTCKISMNFTTSDNGQSLDWRITLAIDEKIKRYLNKSGDYEYTFEFEKNNHHYNVSFNWSDMMNYSDLIFKHGVKIVDGNKYFWWCVRRNDIPPDYYVELDPEYTVFSGTNVATFSNNARRLIRLSNGTYWCTFQENSDVHAAWSDDSGATWNDNEIHGDHTSENPSLAVDSNDVIHMVWEGFSALDVDNYHIRYTNSTDWNEKVNISRTDTQDYFFPSIAIDSNDNIHVAFERDDGADSEILYLNSTDNGGSWSVTQTLTSETDSADDEWYPSIAINSTDAVHIAFMIEDYVGGLGEFDSIFHMESTDGGVTWTGYLDDLVLHTINNEYFPCLAIDDDDTLIVIGADTSRDMYYRYNMTSMSGWDHGGAGEEIYFDGDRPSITVNDNNSVHMAFEDWGDNDIFSMTNWSDKNGLESTVTLLIGTYEGASAICSQYPVIDSAKTNRPVTGYAFICTGDTNQNVSFYSSSDLTWETATVGENWQNVNVWNTTLTNNTFTWNNVTTWNTTLTNGTWNWEGNNIDVWNITLLNESIVFNFISMAPSDILINSTGNLLITYNVTTYNTGLNKTSLLIAHVLNNTRTLHLNNTYTLYAENWVPDKKCAINRNYAYWFENEFSYLTGDNTIGNIGEWAVHNETLYEEITINSQGSNWINFTHNLSILENLFGNIFLVNREAQTIENKIGQTFDVYKDVACRISFNMSDTQWWNDTEYNNTYYTLHFYAEEINPDRDLFVYYANDSYTTGNPLTSPYCELIGTLTMGQDYDYIVRNSSYYDISFSSDTNGTIGSVGMTDNFSFIFASNSKDDTHKWVVYYADDNLTVLGEYHNFNISSCSMTCDDKGVTWVAHNGTIDAFLTYGHLGNIDRIQYKVYCQMNGTDTGDGDWSSILIDVLDETNLPPNIPNVITPNGTITDYNIGDIINVTYSWLGDPNLDTCWLNMTVVDASDIIVHYLQNRSITSDEYEVNNTWWYEWDTTGLSQGGPYHVNITATDEHDLFRYTGLDGIFWLNYTWDNHNIDVWNLTLSNGTFIWEDHNINVWNITLVNGTFTWRNVTTWNTTLSNTSIEEWQNANIWNITLVNGTFIWNNVTTWNTTLSNLTEEWVNINIWNITLSNLTTYNNINIWNTTLVNSSIDLITVTNEFPDNQSINIPLQPTMYLTINHTEGETMNISWYYGTQGNENTLLGTDVNFTNSTQSELNWNASNRVTDYYWRVMINDGTNYVNYSFEFQTEGYNPGINMDRGIWMIFAIMFIIPIALLFMGIKKKKNDEGEY